jgi:hypothetical protein
VKEYINVLKNRAIAEHLANMQQPVVHPRDFDWQLENPFADPVPVAVLEQPAATPKKLQQRAILSNFTFVGNPGIFCLPLAIRTLH